MEGRPRRQRRRRGAEEENHGAGPTISSDSAQQVYKNHLFSCQSIDTFERRHATAIYAGYNTNAVVTGHSASNLQRVWMFGRDDEDQLGFGGDGRNNRAQFRATPKPVRFARVRTRYFEHFDTKPRRKRREKRRRGGDATDTRGRRRTRQDSLSTFSSSSDEERVPTTVSTEIYDVSDRGGIRVACSDVEQMAMGAEHSLLLTTHGQVFYTGSGCDKFWFTRKMSSRAHRSPSVPSAGWRCLEFTTRRSVVAVAAGRSHSLLLLSDGQVLACGSNQHGQLGVTSKTVQEELSTRQRTHRHHSNFMPVSSLRDKGVRSIVCGEYQSFAITVSQDVFAWGRARAPRGGDPLGLNTSGRDVPQHLTLSSAKLHVNGGETSVDETKVNGDDADDPLPGSIAWDRANRAKRERERARIESDRAAEALLADQISAHVAEGSVDIPKRVAAVEKHFITNVAAGDRHTLFLAQEHRTTTNALHTDAQYDVQDRESSRGRDREHRRLLGKRTRGSADSRRPATTKLTTTTYSVYATGDAECGQVGLGDTRPRRTPEKILGAPVDTVRVSAGSRHSALVTESGDLYMFGNAENGRLGFSSANAKEKPPREVRPQKVTAISSAVFASDREYGWMRLRRSLDLSAAPQLLRARLDEATEYLRTQRGSDLWKRAMERRFVRVDVVPPAEEGGNKGGRGGPGGSHDLSKRSRRRQRWKGGLSRVQRLFRSIRGYLEASARFNCHFAMQRVYQHIDPYDEQKVRAKTFRSGLFDLMGVPVSRREAARLCKEHGHPYEIATQLTPIHVLTEDEFLRACIDLLGARQFASSGSSSSDGSVDALWGRLCVHGWVRAFCYRCKNAAPKEVSCEYVRAFADADGLSATAHLLREERDVLSSSVASCPQSFRRCRDRFAFDSAFSVRRLIERRCGRGRRREGESASSEGSEKIGDEAEGGTNFQKDLSAEDRPHRKRPSRIARAWHRYFQRREDRKASKRREAYRHDRAQRSKEYPSVPPYLVRMFETAVRSHKYPEKSAQAFLSPLLIERWFGNDGSLRCGELRLSDEDVFYDDCAGEEVYEDRNDERASARPPVYDDARHASFVALVELILDLIRTIPIVCVLDVRALPRPLPFATLKRIESVLRRQHATVRLNVGRCNKCDAERPVRLWAQPVQPCQRISCAGGILVRCYHRLGDVRLPKGQRLGAAIELAKADLVARFAAKAARHFPAVDGNSSTGTIGGESSSTTDESSAAPSVSHMGALPRTAYDRLYLAEMTRQARLFGVALEPKTMRMWPDATERGTAREEVRVEYLADPESEEENDDDDDFGDAAVARHFGGGGEGGDTSEDDDEDAIPQKDAYRFVEGDLEDFELFDATTSASDRFRPQTWKRPPSAPMSAMSASIREAIRSRFEKDKAAMARKTDTASTEVSSYVNDDDYEEYAAGDDDDDDDGSSWVSRLNDEDRRRLMMIPSNEHTNGRTGSSRRRGVSGDFASRFDPSSAFPLKTLTGRFLRSLTLRGTELPPQWRKVRRTERHESSSRAPRRLGYFLRKGIRGLLSIPFVRKTNVVADSSTPSRSAARPTTRDMHRDAVQRSTQRAIGRPRSRSRPWRGKRALDHGERIRRAVRRCTLLLCPSWAAFRVENVALAARSAVERLQRMSMARTFEINAPPSSALHDFRDFTVTLEPVVSILAGLRSEYWTQRRRNQLLWRKRQLAFRTLLARLGSAGDDVAQAAEADARTVERQRSCEWRAWNAWSSTCRRGLLRLEDLVESLRFGLEFGRRSLNECLVDFHRGGVAYYRVLFYRQFATYLNATVQRTLRKAHLDVHRANASIGGGRGEHRKDGGGRKRVSRKGIVGAVFRNASVRAKSRLDAWRAPDDLQDVATELLRRYEVFLVEHFTKLKSLSMVTNVQCGRSHSLVLTRSGEVWSLGMFHVSGGVAGGRGGVGYARQRHARDTSGLLWLEKSFKRSIEDRRKERVAIFRRDDAERNGRRVDAGRSADKDKDEASYFTAFDRDEPLKASLLNMILLLDFESMLRWFRARPTKLRHALWRLCRRHMVYGLHRDPSWVQDPRSALELVRKRVKYVMGK